MNWRRSPDLQERENERRQVSTADVDIELLLAEKCDAGRVRAVPYFLGQVSLIGSVADLVQRLVQRTAFTGRQRQVVRLSDGRLWYL